MLWELEEAKWLIVGLVFPMIVYTDHITLLSVLKGNGTKAAGHHHSRILLQMLRIAEYDVEYHHFKEGDNVLSDGLSHLTPLFIDPSRQEFSYQEDVAAVDDVEKWNRWMSYEWYGNIAWYKLTGSLKTMAKDSKQARKLKQMSERYVLMDSEGIPKLLYREVTSELARCM